MEIKVVRQDKNLNHLALHGSLDLTAAQAVEAEFHRKVIDRKSDTILDLSGLEYIGSPGISLLFTAVKALHDCGHRVAILNPRSNAERALRLVRMDHVASFVSSTDQAMAIFTAGPR